MEEVLFRGKRKDNKEWVYWDVFGRMVLRDRNEFNFCFNDKFEYLYVKDIQNVLIYETIGQYTRIKDEHGDILFMGDVVLYKNVKYEIMRGIDGFCIFSMDNFRKAAWDENESDKIKKIFNGKPIEEKYELLFSEIINDKFVDRCGFKDHIKCRKIGNAHDNTEPLNT